MWRSYYYRLSVNPVCVLHSHVSPNRHLGVVVRVDVPLATFVILDVAAGTGISIRLPGRQSVHTLVWMPPACEAQ